MRLSEIGDPALRQWAVDYTASKLEEHRKSSVRVEQLRRVWASYGEGDWAAWRALQDLRARAAGRFEQGEIDTAILRRITLSPRIERNDTTYPAPYSLGLEVSVLKELLGADRV